MLKNNLVFNIKKGLNGEKTMGALIFLIVIIGVCVWLVQNSKRKLESAKNFLMGEKGYCLDCKYCIRDDAKQYSDTGYFCRLSKCIGINETTVMDCMEKPTITEKDLEDLFDLDIWTQEGELYLRNSLLGKKMTFSEIDAFLTALPQEHPQYIKQKEEKDF